ncbi:MAG: DUF4136 domain-containing protein [Caldimonas sp.]
MKPILLAVATLVLSGCAAMNRLDSDVSTYSRWPDGRKPATYAFERLPSQQARPEQQQLLEDAARPAVEAAGFTAASDPKAADVTVQVGARITATDRSPFDDPLWWGPGFRRPYPFARGSRVFLGTGWRYGWGPRWDDYGYEREVALLIRDHKTGEPLYEARANNDGLTPMVETALPAMFKATLQDFPAGGANPRRISIDLKPPAG